MKILAVFLFPVMLFASSARAVCFSPTFDVTGASLGCDLQAEAEATEQADALAAKKCGTDSYNWSARKSSYHYSNCEDGNNHTEATASYQCCSAW